jgi:autotransporter translocation and assembly factor TamB
MLRQALKLSAITLVALFVLLLLVAAPPRFLEAVIQPVRMLLVSAATTMISRSLNGTLEIGKVEGSMLSAPLVHDISLKDGQGEQLIQIDNLSLRYALAELFRGRVRIQELVITRPQLRLAWDAQGHSNLLSVLPPAPAQAESPSPDPEAAIPLILELVKVRQGMVDLTHPALPGVRQVDAIAMEFSGETGEDGLHLRWQHGSAQTMPAEVNLEALQGALLVSAKGVQLEPWRLKTGTSQIALKGTLAADAHPTRLQLELVPLNMGEIGRLLGEQTLQGEVRGVLQAAGPTEALEFDGRLSAGSGEMLLSGALDTQGPLPAYQGSLQLSKFDLAELISRDALRSDLNVKLQMQAKGLSPRELDGDLELLIGPSQIGDVTIKPSKVHLSAGSEQLQVQQFQLLTSAFSAVLAGEIDLTGASALTYRVEVELERLRELMAVNTLSGKAQLHGRVTGTWPDTYVDGRLEASGILFDDTALQALELGYRVAGFASEPTVTAKLDARAARIGGIEIESASGDTTYAFDGKSHRARFSARLIQSATVKAELKGALASDGKHTELTLEHLTSQVEDHLWQNTTPLHVVLAPDSLRVAPFRLAHGDEFVTLSGDLQDGRLEDVVLTANNIDLTFVGRVAALPALLTGRGDLALDLRGTLEAPLLKTEISVRTDQDQHPPFDQGLLRLNYAQNKLDAEAYIEQDRQRVLAAELALPLDLAFEPIPLDQRLLAAPLTASLDIERPQLDRLRDSLPDIPLPGTLQGRIEVAGTYTDLAIDSHLDLEGFALPATKLAIAARLNQEQLQFEQLSASTDASELKAQGEITLAEQRLAMQWQIPRLELREFVAAFPERLPSLVSGRLDLAGTLQDPVLSSSLKYAGGALNADLKLGLGVPTPEYQVDLRIAELGLARFDANLQGNLNASVNVQGTGFNDEDREARIEVSLEAKDFNLAPELKGRLQASLSGRSLDVASLQLHSTPLELQAQGVLSATRVSDFGYRLTVHDLSSLQGYAPAELQARGELEGRISGSRGTLHNQSSLALTDWRYADWQGGEARAELKVDDLLADWQATASADITGLQSAHLASTALRLEANYRSDHGKFSIAVTDGPLAQSLLVAQIHTEQGVLVRIAPLRLQHDDWVWENEKPIQLKADASGSIRIDELNLTNAEQRINAQGSWSPDGTLALQARLDRLQIKPVTALFNLGAEALDGLIDAELDIAGSLEQPQVDAALQASALRWQQQDMGEIDAQLNTAGSVWIGKASWIDQQKTLLMLDGRLDRNASDRLDVEVSAPNFDLSMLQHLSPEILHSDGRLRLQLALSGSLSQPQAFGTLDLQDGELRLAALGAAYRDIQSQLSFNGTRVNIEQLQASSSTGVANLDGWIETADLALDKVDLKLNADEFTLMQTPALAAVVSSDLTLRGSAEDLMAAGELEVVRARLRYEALPSSGPAKVEPWELTVEGVFGAGDREIADANTPQSRQRSIPPLPFLRTDVRVKLPDNSWVQGSGTAVEIDGDIRVNKALKRPFTVTGKLRTLRGFATFFGRRFIVEKGQISFTGSEEIDPLLEVEASHQVAGYMTYARITGKTSKPEVSFRSEPELGESDIISLLIFGRTSDQLTASEQNSLGSQALSLAGRLAADALERSLGDSLGLDAIAIETGDETTSTSVGAGRYIGQGLFLFYERTVRDPTRSNRSGNTVGIEKRLSPRQTLKATGSDLGETSIDWRWQYDY